MSLPALATLDDLEARQGSSVDDPTQALAMLRYASALVRAYAGESWVDDDNELADVPGSIPDVVVEVVYRAASNPDGATQQVAGEYAVSYSTDAAQRMYLTKSDKAIIGAASGNGSQVAFTIDPTPQTEEESDLIGAWVNGPYGTAPGERDWL